MRLLHPIRNNPLTAFTVVVVALIAWIAAELVATPKNNNTKQAVGLIRKLPPPLPDKPEDLAAMQPTPAMDAVTDTDGPAAHPFLGQSTRVLASALTKVRPGMTRAEVERLLGAPAADKVLPLIVDDGRLTYRTAYELVDLGGPNTVRPIPRRPLPPVAGQTAPPSVVALEFDASRPGHPLVEVLYPDPLF